MYTVSLNIKNNSTRYANVFGRSSQLYLTSKIPFMADNDQSSEASVRKVGRLTSAICYPIKSYQIKRVCFIIITFIFI